MTNKQKISGPYYFLLNYIYLKYDGWNVSTLGTAAWKRISITGFVLVLIIDIIDTNVSVLDDVAWSFPKCIIARRPFLSYTLIGGYVPERSYKYLGEMYVIRPYTQLFKSNNGGLNSPFISNSITTSKNCRFTPKDF